MIKKFTDILECLRPENTFFVKKRLGPDEDGGYVVPEIVLEKCSALMCYGVGGDMRYEEEFAEKYKKPTLLFDHTVTPNIGHWNNDNLKFTPEGLGIGKEKCKDWYEHYSELNLTGEVLLKIDIESGEYEYFKTTDISQLSEKVLGILLEVHWIDSEPNRLSTIDIFNKINSEFALCHIHGNNWGDLWEYKGFNLPKVLELTFINRKLASTTKPDTQAYPIPGLDLPNNPSKEDYQLDFIQTRSDIYMSTEVNSSIESLTQEPYKTEAIVTLTTIPSRLSSNSEINIKSCLDSLLNQSFNNYEIHLNIPEVHKLTGETYALPEWLEELALSNSKLKIFRTPDIGPITRMVETLKRITDPECIIITADDDLVYHTDMVLEQYKNQKERFTDCAVGYDGMSSLDNIFKDIRNHYVTSVPCNVRVNVLQHYKTVSYKRRYFDNDFFEEFIDKSWNDDIVVSAYMGKRKITKYVTYFENERIPMNVKEWQEFGGVTTFPVLRHTQHESNEGCNLRRQNKEEDNFNYFVSLGYLR